MYKYLILCALLLCASALQAGSINDPMRPSGVQHKLPPASEQVSAPSYRLDSILIATDRRLSVINGKQLAEGEYIDKFKVVRIEATRVTLRSGSRSQILTLLPISVKSPPSEAKP